jgi:hypothetical protein
MPWAIQDTYIAGPALGVHTYSGADLLVMADVEYHNYGYGAVPRLLYSVRNQSGSILKNLVEISSGPVFGEPSVANYSEKLLVVWRDGQNQTGQVYLSQMSSSGYSFGAPTVQNSNTGWINNGGVRAVVALASYPGGVRGVFAEQSGSSVVYKWYEYNGNNYWTEITGTNFSTGREYDLSLEHRYRIGISYLQDATLPGGGRWYMIYKKPAAGFDPWPNGRLWMDMTRGAGTSTIWENDAYYDNSYSVSSKGFSLYGWRPGSAEQNLRFAAHYLGGSQLQFRPFADGILNLQLKDTNDFAIMERSVCSSVKGSCTSPACTYGGDSACPGD